MCIGDGAEDTTLRYIPSLRPARRKRAYRLVQDKGDNAPRYDEVPADPDGTASQIHDIIDTSKVEAGRMHFVFSMDGSASMDGQPGQGLGRPYQHFLQSS